MKNQVLKSVVIIPLLFSNSFVWACGGGIATKYQVSFAKDVGDGLAVTLTNPDDKSSMEYNDDTGFLSAHLAITYLAKNAAADGKIDLEKNKPTVDFMKARLAVLQKVLDGYLTADTKPEIMNAIDKFKAKLDNLGVNKSDLTLSWANIGNALYKNGVFIKVASRSPGAQWGDEVELNKMIPKQIPTYQLYRAIGSCNDGIGGWDTTQHAAGEAAPAKAKADPLPSFGIQ